MNAVEEDDLDLDAGRHLDDGLVLFGALDEVLAHRVGSFARALAKAARDNVGGGERLALAVSADLACEDAIGVGGKAPTKAADDRSEEHTSELQSQIHNSYDDYGLKNKHTI